MPAILLFPRATASPTPAYLASSRCYAILSVTGCVGALALTSVLLRLYVRVRMLKNIGSDDVVMAVAMLFGIAVYACFIAESFHGLGRHDQTLLPAELTSYLRIQFFHAITGLLALYIVKISIALLLMRLVKYRRYAYFLWAIIVFLTLYNIAALGTFVFACLPISANWDAAAKVGAKCLPSHVFVILGIMHSVTGIVTDAILALLPIPLVWSLQLNPRVKIALNCVMGLGFIAVAAGSIKVHAQLTFLKDTDRIYHDRLYFWAALELYLGILAASLPTLRPLVAAFFTIATSSLSDSGGVRREQQQFKLQQYRNDAVRDFGNYNGSLTSTNIYADSSNSDRASQKPAGAAEKRGFFGFFRKSERPQQTRCSRIGSIALGTVQWHDIAELPGDDLSVMDKEVCIVRTTRVITTTEHSSSLTLADEATSSRSSRASSSNDGLHKEKSRQSETRSERLSGVDTATAVLRLFEKP